MEHPYKAKFIAAEGIDGCGKGTAVAAMRKWAEEQDLAVFDMELFCKKHNRFPKIEEIEEQVIVSQEPTFGPVGRMIREVLTKKEGYSPKTLAHAFSLDREMYFREVVIPARKAGKFIFQERSVVSTLCYQGIMEEGMTGYVLELEGNKLALRESPDLVIAITAEVGAAIERVKERSERTHLPMSLFEKKDYLLRVQERLNSGWLKELLDMYGTRLVFIDNSPPKTQEQFSQEVAMLLAKMRLG